MNTSATCDFKSAVSTNSTIRAAWRGANSAPLDRHLPCTTGVYRWRRDPESNRADRICNPVHNRFAIAPKTLRQAPQPEGIGTDKKGKPGLPFLRNLEREKSLELSTSTLARLRSTN